VGASAILKAAPPKTATYDIAAIGAGVLGSWTAHHLRRDGKRVILIDSFGEASSRASSGGESRVIRCAYGVDEIYSRFAKYIWNVGKVRKLQPLLSVL
jgi:glycine/D-amino acid oxidase-like deaminating enzyme